MFVRFSDRSHAPRGNAAPGALRPAQNDAERQEMHSHAERGNDQGLDLLQTLGDRSFDPVRIQPAFGQHLRRLCVFDVDIRQAQVQH